METGTHSQELVVWTVPQALEEARSIFALYAPTFETKVTKRFTDKNQARVSVVYVSHPKEDSGIEKILTSLRDAKISSLVLYVPHHSANFAFHVGTIIGRHNFVHTELTGDFRHLKQLLKQRNILAQGSSSEDQEDSSDLAGIRERLGLSQAALAEGLNITVRTLQNWEAGKGTSQMSKKTADLRQLLSRMDDYVVAPKEKEWLSTPLSAFRGSTPKQMISEGRIRDLVVEFDRLSEGQPV
jgi:DNA-binding transcriptional regulator YiaG